MKFKSLSNKEYNVPLKDALNKESRLHSKLHISARHLLREMFPTCNILEELPIKIRRGETLFLDFYIPLYNFAVEVNGQQHYQFTPLFHHTKLNFYQSQRRDESKKEWCRLNNIVLIELRWNEQKKWKQQIQSR